MFLKKKKKILSEKCAIESYWKMQQKAIFYYFSPILVYEINNVHLLAFDNRRIVQHCALPSQLGL